MPKYTIHVYQEFRTIVPEIEADTPEEAMKIALDKAGRDPTLETVNCEGKQLAALIDQHTGDSTTREVGCYDLCEVKELDQPRRLY